MGLFDWFKKNKVEEKTIQLNKKKEKEYDVVKTIVEGSDCDSCPLQRDCENSETHMCLEKTQQVYNDCKDKDGNIKPIIILLDDNAGILSLLEDDLYSLEDDGYINMDDYCIVRFSGILAVFEYLPFLRKNFKYIQGGIFDLTIGGVLRYKNENVRLTGMDAIYANSLKGINRNIIFTGNTLNPNIQSNNMVTEQYEKITGRNLIDDVIFKTSFDDKERQRLIYEKLFK